MFDHPSQRAGGVERDIGWIGGERGGGGGRGLGGGLEVGEDGGIRVFVKVVGA